VIPEDAVRTTVTFDDDVAEQLREEMARSGRSFKETVNAILRRGLHTQTPPVPRPSLHPGRALGVRAGIDLDNIEELLDQIEGPLRA
jgi:plasmid stability protein